MATKTYNLELTKYDLTDPASPTPMNDNMDIIDANLAELNRYKSTIDELNSKIPTIEADSKQAKTDAADALTNAKAYTDEKIGNLSTVLDEINGEEI